MGATISAKRTTLTRKQAGAVDRWVIGADNVDGSRACAEAARCFKAEDGNLVMIATIRTAGALADCLLRKSGEAADHAYYLFTVAQTGKNMDYIEAHRDAACLKTLAGVARRSLDGMILLAALN